MRGAPVLRFRRPLLVYYMCRLFCDRRPPKNGLDWIYFATVGGADWIHFATVLALFCDTRGAILRQTFVSRLVRIVSGGEAKVVLVAAQLATKGGFRAAPFCFGPVTT